jgi:hypothetical protein
VVLKNASAGAKPPTMQGKSGGPLPQNTKRSKR